MSFDDIYRRLEAKKAREAKQVSTSLPGNAPSATAYDLHGLIDNLIRDEVARRLHDLPAPEKAPLPRRIQAIADRMQKAHAGVPKPAASHVDQPAATSVPAAEPFAVPMDVGRGAQAREVIVGTKRPLPERVGISILSRDHRNRALRVRFDTDAGQSYIGTVAERDMNGAISRASFELVKVA